MVEIEYTITHPTSGMTFSAPDEAYPTRPLFAISDNETERYCAIMMIHTQESERARERARASEVSIIGSCC